MIPVGIDDGHAQIKVFNARHKICESFASRGKQGVNGISDFEGNGSSVYDIHGTAYVVHESLSDAENTRFSDYPVSALNHALILSAIESVGLSQPKYLDEGLCIVTGLPISDYYLPDGTLNKALIDQKSQSFSGVFKKTDGTVIADIKRHHVAPEGLTGWVQSMKEVGKGHKQHSSFWMAVVDIGGRTTDVAVVSPNSLEVNHQYTESLDIGVLSIFDQIRSLTKNRHLPDALLDDALNSWFNKKPVCYFERGQKMDITAIVEQAVSIVAQKLNHLVDGLLTRHSQVSEIVVLGGGCHVLSPSLEFEHRTPKNPEMANAMAMYSKAMSLTTKGK